MGPQTPQTPQTSQTPRATARLMLTAVTLVVGLAVCAAVTYLWPGLLIVSIILACFLLISVVIALSVTVGRRWVPWVSVPVVAVAGLGTLMFAEDLASTRFGEATDVVVVDHSVDVQERRDSSGSYTAYTHTYRLETTDGTEVAEPMLYRGDGGYDGVDVGSRLTVLIDADGRAPVQPVDAVDLDADKGILTVGLVATALVFLAAVVSLRRGTRKNHLRH